MSKNVLIISSSPRKGGNSDVLCDQFMKGAEESGNQVKKSGYLRCRCLADRGYSGKSGYGGSIPDGEKHLLI